MNLSEVSNSLTSLFSRKHSIPEKSFISSHCVQLTGWLQKIVPALIAMLGVSIFGCSILAFCTCMTVLPGVSLVILGSLLLYWAYHQIASMHVNMAVAFNSFSSSSERSIQ
ncbi:hypothetical protein [Chlamydia sp.]|uniref:hypothetical protein n=1 Tax=Chlamydia sp. TaxID=35827 RepID=UPI0025B8CAF6|nr:hypothetical protein [Chlamydia sp.]MBQ8498651.1 hypothetical protein [Chlamydia sp.]